MTTEDENSWDAIDETKSFQEKLGKSGDGAVMPASDDPQPLSMPDEPLDLEYSSNDMNEPGMEMDEDQDDEAI